MSEKTIAASIPNASTGMSVTCAASSGVRISSSIECCLAQRPVLRHVRAPPAAAARRACARSAGRDRREARATSARRPAGRPRARSRRALCHATLPTKNGPSRSRWSEVCRVFRIRWTMIESGWSSGPRSPTTKSLSALVEAVAREPDVVPEPCAPERHPDAAVLHQDRVLLLARQLLERAGAAERVPDRPRRARVEHAPPGRATRVSSRSCS